jgi:hypothetical protein
MYMEEDLFDIRWNKSCLKEFKTWLRPTPSLHPTREQTDYSSRKGSRAIGHSLQANCGPRCIYLHDQINSIYKILRMANSNVDKIHTAIKAVNYELQTKTPSLTLKQKPKPIPERVGELMRLLRTVSVFETDIKTILIFEGQFLRLFWLNSVPKCTTIASIPAIDRLQYPLPIEAPPITEISHIWCITPTAVGTSSMDNSILNIGPNLALIVRRSERASKATLQ